MTPGVAGNFFHLSQKSLPCSDSRCDGGTQGTSGKASPDFPLTLLFAFASLSHWAAFRGLAGGLAGVAGGSAFFLPMTPLTIAQLAIKYILLILLDSKMMISRTSMLVVSLVESAL